MLSTDIIARSDDENHGKRPQAIQVWRMVRRLELDKVAKNLNRHKEPLFILNFFWTKNCPVVTMAWRYRHIFILYF